MTTRRAALALLVLAAGCGGKRIRVPPPPPLDPPRLAIEQVLPASFDAFGATVEVRGRMENPNPVDMPITGFDYAVAVDGRGVDAARLPSRLVIPAGATVPFSVPCTLHWARVPEVVVAFATRRSLDLALTGAVRVYGGQVLPWAADASVVLPLLPSLELTDSRVREKGFTQITTELTVTVKNPNDFPLPTGKLHVDVIVSGSVVANAQSYALSEVPPLGEAVIIIPVKFSPLGTVGAALGGALKLQAHVRIKGRAGWGGLEVAVDQKVGL
jgi:LEA14-like dessication related protein